MPKTYKTLKLAIVEIAECAACGDEAEVFEGVCQRCQNDSRYYLINNRYPGGEKITFMDSVMDAAMKPWTGFPCL